jgi:hypothetical protein
MLNQKLMGKVGEDKQFVEDLFSTYLYTGTGAAQTINNGIDLAGKGGMVWIRTRNFADLHRLYDTQRGANNSLDTFQAISAQTTTNALTGFTSSGFSLGSDPSGGVNGGDGQNYVSWTFRKAPKFFDVVTWTGNGANRTVTHSLGSVPGMIIVKRTDTTADWQVYHRSNANTQYMVLNTTAAVATGTTRWNSTTPTASVFSLGTDATVNASGGTYVAYLFAHDTTTDGLIQCGSYTGTGSATGPTVSLGWEPQYLMIKNASGTGNWQLIDNMRGMPVGTAEATLQANLTNAESSVEYVSPTATGFQVTSTGTEVNTSGSTYIYMAIRRGPMRTPTDGTKVFKPIALTGTGAATVVEAGFKTDLAISRQRNGNNYTYFIDRLRENLALTPCATDAEATQTSGYPTNPWDYQTGFRVGTGYPTNSNSALHIHYALQRATGFFDVVCYTGTGVARTVNHNLGVAPELMITKCRNKAGTWWVYSAALGATKALQLESNTTPTTSTNIYNDTSPTASSFTVGITSGINGANDPFVAYLFASCPGVSKVGSYTGNGTSQTINCGFTNGARFVLIKRTDSSGDWWAGDTARGIAANNDPLLYFSYQGGEITSLDWIDPDSTGFIINQNSVNLNVNAATYIYLAIA